jgi:hypothetical protein
MQPTRVVPTILFAYVVASCLLCVAVSARRAQPATSGVSADLVRAHPDRQGSADLSIDTTNQYLNNEQQIQEAKQALADNSVDQNYRDDLSDDDFPEVSDTAPKSQQQESDVEFFPLRNTVPFAKRKKNPRRPPRRVRGRLPANTYQL